MRVMVAEDEAFFRSVLLRALAALGHDAKAVADGEALLREMPGFDPDAVLSDIGLPGRGGISVCAELGKTRPDVRIVLMTGDPARAEDARRAGFEDVLLKPFPLDELKRVF